MANPFTKDDWDWPFILYAGRVWLNYTETEIFNMTPRKLFSQLEVHNDIQLIKNGKEPTRTKETLGYIDQIPGW